MMWDAISEFYSFEGKEVKSEGSIRNVCVEIITEAPFYVRLTAKKYI